MYKSALEQTQAGCEKRFRSIKFLPLKRCQNIPHRPFPPAGEPGSRPASRRPLLAAPTSAAPQERVQFPAYSHLSGRRGAAERQRGSAPGGGSGWPCHAEAARPRSRESGHSLVRFLSRGSGTLPPPPCPEGWVPPGTCSNASLGPDLPRTPPLAVATAGDGGWRGPSAHALCWPCP